MSEHVPKNGGIKKQRKADEKMTVTQKSGTSPSSKKAPRVAAPEAQPPDNPHTRVWGEDIDTYPLRESGEDPRWAVRTVWIWVGFALFSLVFVLTFLILGLFYD